MSHLSPAQLLDVAESQARPDEAAHVAQCAVCRDQVAELRHLLEAASADQVPEPSPLFWDHLSARVGRAVREEAEAGARRASWAWRWLPAPALAAAALLAAFVFMPAPAPVTDAPVAARVEMPASPAPVDSADAAQGWFEDASWTLMSDLSRELLAGSDGSALEAEPGTADRALGQLNEQERAALVEIMREELGRVSEPGAPPLGN